MGIDISNLVHDLGINAVHGTNQNSTNSVSNAGGRNVKPSPFSMAGLGHSIAAIPSALGHFVTNALPNIPRLATGISQGLPGIGSIARNQKATNIRMKALDNAERAFTKQFQTGKINKDRYRKLMTDLSKERSAVSAELQGQAKDYVAPGDFAKDLVGTATLPLAAGRLTTAGKLGNVAAKVGGKAASIGGTGTKAAVVEMQSAKGAVKSAAAAPVKNSFIYAPNAQAVKDTSEGKNVGTNAAILAASVVAPAAGKVISKAGSVVKNALFDSAGLFDHVKVAGGKTVNQALKEAQQAVTDGKMSQRQYKTIVDRLKVSQDQNLANHGDPRKAAFNITETQKAAGRPTENMTLQEFAVEQGKLAKAGRKTQQLFAENKLYDNQGNPVDPKLSGRLTVGKAESSEKAQIAQRLAAGHVEGGLNSEYAAVQHEFPDFFKNRNNRSIIEDIIKTSKSPKELRARINQEITGTSELFTKNAQGELVQLRHEGGYHSIVAQKSTPGFKVPSEAASIDTGHKAVFGSVGRTLEKMGLSVQSQDPTVYDKFKSYLDDELQTVGKDAKSVLKKIGDYNNGLQGVGVFDERQLGAHAIKQALGTHSSAEANQVRKAFLHAYGRMTWGDLGAAGKIENALYRVPGYGQYRRIQGIGRYEGNPLFRLQSGVEAELLAQMGTKGKSLNVPLTNQLRQIFRPKSADELGQIAAKVRSHLGEGYSGEGVADNAFGTISAKLFRTQEYSIGGMVKTLAEKSGKSVDDFLAGADRETLDNIRQIVQYRREGFSSSNFAKTLNMFAFPARYNIKLAGIAGRAFTGMSPVTRVATLKALNDYNDFIKSDEGIKWASKNSEVLGIVTYLNPFNNLNKIFQDLQHGDFQISDLGIIGGLPLGVITQIIKTQTGAQIGPNVQYQDPKTGNIIPDKLPASQQAAAKLALIDIINSMYSFPGRTFGSNLSKKEITGGLPGLKIGPGDTVDKKGVPTPYQERVQRVLASSSPKAATPPAKISPPGKRETSYGAKAPVNPKFGGNVSAAAAEAAAKKAKAKQGRVKHKAVRPGQPF